MITADVDYKQQYEQALVTISTLRLELSQLKKIIFGSRQERYIAADLAGGSQLSLDVNVEAIATSAVTAVQKIEYTRATKQTTVAIGSHPGRTKLPEHLRREEVTIEPAGDVSGCKKIGVEITEELDYQPGELYVRKYIRPKYIQLPDEKIMIAPLPARPIDKGIAGPGLLAQVITDKYVDHLPLYRQMQRFERSGVKLPYSTLTDWVTQTCALLTPLLQAHKKAVLDTHYLHADETPIKVLDKDKKDGTHRGYFWVYHNSIDRLVLFDYQPGRGRDGPTGVLKDYSGYLQTDGYVVYDDFDKKPGITLLHCMAHARRGFHEALQNDAPRAGYALEQIGQLYAIERQAKEGQLNTKQRQQLRQDQSLPVLKHMHQWLKDNYVQVLPQSAIGKAIGYSLERWEKLMIYTRDGDLNIDNNPVENSIRPVAIGRKNYLFCGSHQAAVRTAMIYSLVGTCKLHGINPFDWLKDVITRMPTHFISNIAELLPHKWSKLQ